MMTIVGSGRTERAIPALFAAMSTRLMSSGLRATSAIAGSAGAAPRCVCVGCRCRRARHTLNCFWEDARNMRAARSGEGPALQGRVIIISLVARDCSCSPQMTAARAEKMG